MKDATDLLKISTEEELAQQPGWKPIQCQQQEQPIQFTECHVGSF